MEFKAYAERLTGKQIRVLQDDKGGEFTGHRWDAMYAQTGIKPRHTTRKRPEQNGVAERANRTVVEGTCAVLAESGMPHSFWGEALLSFVDVWNRLLSNSTRGRSLKATLTSFGMARSRTSRTSGCGAAGCTPTSSVTRATNWSGT